MAQLTNTPRSETFLRLEARKSFSFALRVVDANSRPLDLTGTTLELSVRRGQDIKNLITNSAATLGAGATAGYARFNLQASDLSLSAGEYPFAITLLDAGYSSVLVRGTVEILDNADMGVGGTYTGGAATTGLEVSLQGQVIVVQAGAIRPPGESAFTDRDREKLDEIEHGAQANVNADWKAGPETPGYIKNRPLDRLVPAPPGAGMVLTSSGGAGTEFGWKAPEEVVIDRTDLYHNPKFTGEVTGLSKAAVGLNNVNNTADLNKPVSHPQQKALDQKADTSELEKKVSKGEPISYAKDFGLVGDGSNEFAKLQTLFTAGGIIILEKGKTYGYDPAATLTLAAGTTLLTNGSVFKELSGGPDRSTFRVNGDTFIDSLRLDLAGGANTRGLLVSGANVKIENLSVIARTLSGVGNWRRRGLVVGIEGSGSKNVHIGHAWVENWDYSVAVFDSERITFDALHMRTSRQGLMANDVVGLTVRSGTDEGISPNATGGPGENSILCGSTRSHHSHRNMRIIDFISKDASEHAFRVGGQLQATGLHFIRCQAIGAGSGQGTGGCGFKVLGPTSILSSSAKHSNIYFTDCVVEDSKNFRGANTEAFHVGKSRNVVIDNPIVRTSAVPSVAEQANSAFHGLRIFGSQVVTVNNPQIHKVLGHGIWIHDIEDNATTNNGGGLDQISVNGGSLTQNPNHIYLDTPQTARRIVVKTTTEGGNYSVYATALSVLNRCIFEVNSHSATVANFAGLSGCITTLRGDIVGPPSGRGGSTYVDYSTGRTYIAASGGWKVQGLSGTTGSRPAVAIIGDTYYDTSLGKPVWLKSAGPNVWVDASGAAV